jgi:radical SAM superfamily enzyme YgiQ (UPF0313 family)/SAM-dependent methyltransferase
MENHPARSLDFIVCGMPRGGTTLLGEMLNGHPDVYCHFETGLFRQLWMFGADRPFPPENLHILEPWLRDGFRTHLLEFRRAVSKEEKYGRYESLLQEYQLGENGTDGLGLFDSGDVERLIAQVLNLFERRLHGPPLFHAGADLLAESIREKTKRSIIGEKLPDNLMALDPILSACPFTQAFCIIREPFSTMSSMIASSKKGNHVWDQGFASNFSRALSDCAGYLRRALRSVDSYPASRFHLLRYEDLMARPSELMRSVFGWIGSPDSVQALEFAERLVWAPGRKSPQDLGFTALETALARFVLEPTIAKLGYADEFYRACGWDIAQAAPDESHIDECVLTLDGIHQETAEAGIHHLWMEKESHLFVIFSKRRRRIAFDLWSAFPEPLVRGSVRLRAFSGDRLVGETQVPAGEQQTSLSIDVGDLAAHDLNAGFSGALIHLKSSLGFRPITVAGMSPDMREVSFLLRSLELDGPGGDPVPDYDALQTGKASGRGSARPATESCQTGMKLHLGCGTTKLDGYINIDIVPTPAADLTADIQHLPFRDGAVDEIRLDAVFEHLYRQERAGALLEWFRVLRPGGKLILNRIPDFDGVIDAYRTGLPGMQREKFDLHEVWRYVFGFSTSCAPPYHHHKDIFTAASLVRELKDAGFETAFIRNARDGDRIVPVLLEATGRRPDSSPPAKPDRADSGGMARGGPGGPTLSAVVCTWNDEETIEDCLDAIREVVDEILVVDQHSDDRTVEIARNHTDRVYFHPPAAGREPARRFGVNQAKGNWILLLNGSERITPELADRLREVISHAEGVDVFRIPRRNRIAGRWMQGTGWGIDTDRPPRLFRKESQERPVTGSTEAPVPLPPEARIDRFASRDLSAWVSSLDHRANQDCEILNDHGTVWSPDSMLRAMRGELDHRYDPESDGSHSLMLALSAAFQRFLGWAKLWERQEYPAGALPEDVDDILATLAGKPGFRIPPRGDRTPESFRFGSGFYDKEGDWRWMNEEGSIHILPTDRSVEVRFTLTCSQGEHYEQFPFQVHIYVEFQRTATVTFDSDNQTQDVRLCLPRSNRPVEVRIKSLQSFIPLYRGLEPDIRILSVRLGNLSVEPVDREREPSGAPDIGPARTESPHPQQGEAVRRSSALRLGLVIADPTPSDARFSSDSPLAFGYFVSYLREHMPACEIAFRYSIDEVLDEGVDIVGISASTERFELAKKMAARVKERCDIPVVIGGVHITVLPNNLSTSMDVAVLGEGEVTLVELLECFLQRGRRFLPEDLRKIPGIAFREDGRIHRTPPRLPIKPLDTLPIPDRKVLDIGLPSDRAFLFTSRGCPYRCTFCASSRFWQNLRYFSAEYVVREIEHIHRDLGVHNIHFFDDLFITPKRRLREICRLIEERGLHHEVNLTGAVHAHLVDRELCETLNRMNVTEVMFGAESFSPPVLDYLKCGKATPEDNQRAIDLLNEYGILPNLSMIYGAPPETRGDLEMSFRALEENLQAGKVGRWQYCRLRLYPGTPIWDEALRRGIVSEDMNWDEIEHPPARHFMGAMPEGEFEALLQEHKERSIAIAPDNVQMWQEWGLNSREVAQVLVVRRPDLMRPYLDFSRDHSPAQLGAGWYAIEGDDGNRFRWMGRESVTYLAGDPETAHLQIRGSALLEKLGQDTLSLNVSLNGASLGCVPIGESPFCLALEIPEPLRTEGLQELTLTASTTFRAPPDVRDLSVIVSAIGLVPQKTITENTEGKSVVGAQEPAHPRTTQ